MRRIIIFDIDYTLFDTDVFKQSSLTAHSVYPEVKHVLKQLSKLAILGILSEGNVILQSTKLRKTNIDSFFHKDHIHIVADKSLHLKEFLNKYTDDEIILIDDRLTILHQAKMINPSVTTIWVKRGKFAASQVPIQGFTADAVVENLEEVTNIVTKAIKNED